MAMTTIDNLKTAIIGESTASAKYAAYATRAAQEGYPLIEKLFAAASRAERIHATNHNKVLVKLGEAPIDIEMHIEVGNTIENLKAAIVGETYEFTDMYPPMIRCRAQLHLGQRGRKGTRRSVQQGSRPAGSR